VCALCAPPGAVGMAIGGGLGGVGRVHGGDEVAEEEAVAFEFGAHRRILHLPPTSAATYRGDGGARCIASAPLS
jgi:hypothetical protein